MNEKEKFWQDLKAPPPDKRSCWNCKHGLIEDEFDGYPVVGGCAKKKQESCVYNVWGKKDGYQYDEWELRD